MEIFIGTIRELWGSLHSGGWPELGWWSYLLLAMLVATEGPVSTLLGAAAAATGVLDLRYVFLASFTGNVLGDCLWYSVGYVNNLQRINRFSRFIGIHSHHLDRLEVEMHTHATKLIALSKLAIGLIIPTLVAAGLARVPWRRWFPLVLTIETLWTLIMVNLGYHSAGLITQLEHGLQILGTIVLVVVLFVAFAYGRRHFKQGKKHPKSVPQDKLTDDPISIQLAPVMSVPLRRSAAPTFDVTLLQSSPTCKRFGYKQLVHKLSRARLNAKTISIKSFSAKSAMTQALAQAITMRCVVNSLAISNRSQHIQGHFAGD